MSDQGDYRQERRFCVMPAAEILKGCTNGKDAVNGHRMTQKTVDVAQIVVVPKVPLAQVDGLGLEVTGNDVEFAVTGEDVELYATGVLPVPVKIGLVKLPGVEVVAGAVVVEQMPERGAPDKVTEVELYATGVLPVPVKIGLVKLPGVEIVAGAVVVDVALKLGEGEAETGKVPIDELEGVVLKLGEGEAETGKVPINELEGYAVGPKSVALKLGDGKPEIGKVSVDELEGYGVGPGSVALKLGEGDAETGTTKVDDGLAPLVDGYPVNGDDVVFGAVPVPGRVKLMLGYGDGNDESTGYGVKFGVDEGLPPVTEVEYVPDLAPESVGNGVNNGAPVVGKPLTPVALILKDGKSEALGTEVEFSFSGVDVAFPNGSSVVRVLEEMFVVGDVELSKYVPVLNPLDSGPAELEVMFEGTSGDVTLLKGETRLDVMFGLVMGPPERTVAVVDPAGEIVDSIEIEEFVGREPVGPPEIMKPVAEPVAKMVELAITKGLMLDDGLETPEMTITVEDSVTELVEIIGTVEFVDGEPVGPPKIIKPVAKPVAKLVELTATERLTIDDVVGLPEMTDPVAEFVELIAREGLMLGLGVGPPEIIKPVAKPVEKLVSLTVIVELAFGLGVGPPEMTNSVLDPVAKLTTVTSIDVPVLDPEITFPEATPPPLRPVE
ncbi:MAG: hypothetical protein Q9165_006516 [Trypethelium subeluteriae]